jgi:NADH:ubiquinone oxidoreductase subunit 3 (subunit A)
MISLFTSAVVTLAEILLEQRAQRQKQQSIEATLEERRREIDEFEARFHKERDSLK